MKPSSFPLSLEKTPKMPVFWSNLTEGIQIEIYEQRLVDLKYPTRVALALELTTVELHGIQNVCRRRKEFPATREQVWAQYSSTGDRSGHVDPSVYGEFITHLRFSDACDWRKNSSVTDLENTLIYLRKVGLPWISLLSIFAAHLRENHRDNDSRLGVTGSLDHLTENKIHLKNVIRKLVFAIGRVEEEDAANTCRDSSCECGIYEESTEKRKNVHAEEERLGLVDQRPGVEGGVAVADHKDTISQLTIGVGSQMLEYGGIDSYTMSADALASIKLPNNDAESANSEVPSITITDSDAEG